MKSCFCRGEICTRAALAALAALAEPERRSRTQKDNLNFAGLSARVARARREHVCVNNLLRDGERARRAPGRAQTPGCGSDLNFRGRGWGKMMIRCGV